MTEQLALGSMPQESSWEVPARVETVTTIMEFGVNNARANGAEPRPGDATGGNASASVPPRGGRAWTWWWANPDLACLRE
jgi:hypothetical protein